MTLPQFEADAANILKWSEIITAVASATPTPVAVFAAPALVIEKMLSGLLTTQMKITGQTAQQILAALPNLTPIP